MTDKNRLLIFLVGHMLFAGGVYAVAGFPGLLMLEGATFMLLGLQINFTSVTI